VLQQAQLDAGVYFVLRIAQQPLAGRFSAARNSGNHAAISSHKRDGNKSFLIGVDSNRVIVGTVVRQP
jgi:hypothetical protein